MNNNDDNLISLKAAKAIVDSLSIALEHKRDEVDHLTEQLESTLRTAAVKLRAFRLEI